MDGIFCSFNCVLAFINDNKHDSLYRESITLLNYFYKTIFGTLPKIFLPAPHWRLLKEYGGHLDIAEFRKSFNHVEYIKMDHVYDISALKLVSNVFKEVK